MNKQDVMKNQGPTCVLRVSIHCQGCKNKVRKILQKIDGVHKTSIDVDQGKVTVTGNVDPAVLISKLEKSGKHAELWGSQKSSNNYAGKNTQFDTLDTHFKNLQMSKGEKKNGGDQRAVYQQSIQQMKGSKDLKVPFNLKEEKTVKIELPKKGGDEFDDFSGDDFDEEDDFDDKELYDSDDEFNYGGKNPAGKEKGGGGVKAKKGEGKTGNKGEKGGGGGPKEGAWEGKSVKATSNGNGVKKGGGFPDFEVTNHHKGGGGGMKGGGFSDFEVSNHQKGGGRGGGFQQIPAAQGRPPAAAMNMNGGGFHPGMGQQMSNNPYQQQQYMGMVNQQRMMGGGVDMQHPAMYGRSPAGYGYAPPMPPPIYHDPLTHMFSDENTESCSVM